MSADMIQVISCECAVETRHRKGTPMSDQPKKSNFFEKKRGNAWWEKIKSISLHSLNRDNNNTKITAKAD